MDHQPTPRILIVEDDQRLAELTAEYLQANGFEVAVEGDGARAARRIAAKAAPTFVATCHGLTGHSCQPCWHDTMFPLALPAPQPSSAMRQSGQPWPDWNGALQQM